MSPLARPELSLPQEQADRVAEVAVWLDLLREVVRSPTTMKPAYALSRLDGLLWALAEPGRSSAAWVVASSRGALALAGGSWPKRLLRGHRGDHVFSRHSIKRRLLATEEPTATVAADAALLVLVTKIENERLGSASGWDKYARAGIELVWRDKP
jgi:hypothetical protein